MARTEAAAAAIRWVRRDLSRPRERERVTGIEKLRNRTNPGRGEAASAPTGVMVGIRDGRADNEWRHPSRRTVMARPCHPGNDRVNHIKSIGQLGIRLNYVACPFIPLHRLAQSGGRCWPRGRSRSWTSAPSQLGYRDVSLLAGGVAGWTAAGGELFTDASAPSKAFGGLVAELTGTPLLRGRAPARLPVRARRTARTGNRLVRPGPRRADRAGRRRERPGPDDRVLARADGLGRHRRDAAPGRGAPRRHRPAGGGTGRITRGPWRPARRAAPAVPLTVPSVLSRWLRDGEAVVIDLETSKRYGAGHIPGAAWALRADLAGIGQASPVLAGQPKRIVLTSSDGYLLVPTGTWQRGPRPTSARGCPPSRVAPRAGPGPDCRCRRMAASCSPPPPMSTAARTRAPASAGRSRSVPGLGVRPGGTA